MSDPCQCPGPGDCPRWGEKVGPLAWGLCGGTGCTPARSEAFRRQRDAKAGRPRAVALPAAAPVERPKAKPAPAPKPKPAGGPGTELKRLLESLGLPAAGCEGCGGWAAKMDAWGVTGCRVPANRAAVLGRLRESQAELGWAAKLTAAANMPVGLAARLLAADPAEVLYDEAVRRAAASPLPPPAPPAEQ